MGSISESGHSFCCTAAPSFICLTRSCRTKFKDVLRACRKQVEQLSGRCARSLAAHISDNGGQAANVHLVAANAASESYRVAQSLRVPIVRREYIGECWKQRRVLPWADHRPKVFTGQRICITGFSDMTKRQNFQKLTHENNGRYQGELNQSVTHLVARCKAGAKYEYAVQNGRPHVVSEQWFAECVRQQVLLSPDRYLPPDPGAAAAETDLRSRSRREQPTTTVANTLATRTQATGGAGTVSMATAGDASGQEGTVQAGGGPADEATAQAPGGRNDGCDDDSSSGSDSDSSELQQCFELVRAAVIGFAGEEAIALRRKVRTGASDAPAPARNLEGRPRVDKIELRAFILRIPSDADVFFPPPCRLRAAAACTLVTPREGW